MIDPVSVDGVALTQDTDFPALALDVLRGGGGAGSLRGDAFPLDWILRAYDALAGTPYAERLARGVAACLTAVEPDVRSQALVFFQQHPRAAGGERVEELVRGDRAPFAGVVDPLHPGTDLLWQLLATLSARAAAGAAGAVELARAEVVRPGCAAALVAVLCSFDATWVLARAEEIVRGTPAAGATILIQLQDRPGGVTELGRRIAPLCRSDARFEVDVSRFVDDPDARRAILDAFRGD